MPRYVPGVGPRPALIVLVGEAPGREEDAAGTPFVGSSGRLLNSMLSNVGIDRSSCYVTNVVKERPPENEFGVFYDDVERRCPTIALVQARAALVDELRSVRPNVIVALGAEALRALTDKHSIEKWRGSVLAGPAGKVVATHHPAAVMRQYELRAVSELDLRRAIRESASPDVRRPPTRFVVQPSFDAVVQRLDVIARDRPTLSFDIESSRDVVRCLGLAWSASEALCIPFTSNGHVIQPGDRHIAFSTGSDTMNSWWSLDEELAILRRLDAMFRDPAVPKIAQNAPFDVQMLARNFGFEVHGLVMDTMLAQHTLYSELPKSLDFLASVYTDFPYYSDYDPADDLSTWTYNCYDCVATLAVASALRAELEDHDLLEFYNRHVHQTMLATLRIQSRGVRVNTTLRDALCVRAKAELVELEARLSALAGRPLNASSTKDVPSYLYETLGMTPQHHHKTKRTTTDEAALVALRVKYPQHAAVLDTILDVRERKKLIGTYYEFPLTSDGLAVTSYNVGGTLNGRLSSSATLWGEGTNLQNPPRGEYRRIFEARDGHVLIKADLAQAEWRLIVWFARIERLIDQFDTAGFDPYKWVAGMIYGTAPEDVTPIQRQAGKVFALAGAYGMRPRKAAMMYKVSVAEASAVLDSYTRAIPEIPRWWGEVQAMVTSRRCVVNPFGRKRFFFGRVDDEMYRQAYNALPQGTVGDVISRAMILGEELFPPGARTVLQVHDELVVEARTDVVDAVVPILRNLLEVPIRFEGVERPCVIPAEISVGPTWFDQERYIRRPETTP